VRVDANMGSSESFNSGTNTNNFLTGFKGLFKRVIGANKSDYIDQRSAEK
jgi:hypothetical protein